MKNVIQTRGDLDAISGTPEHAEFLKHLKGSMKKRINKAEYPEDYDQSKKPEDEGYVAPDWQEVEDLSMIERFGFTKEEIEGLVP